MALNARARLSLIVTRAVRAGTATGASQPESRQFLTPRDFQPRRPSTRARIQQTARHLLSVPRSLLPYFVVGSVYLGTLAVCWVSGVVRRRPWNPTGRIVAIATFFNPGWFLSHVIPLSLSGVDEVIVVTDRPLLPLAKVRFCCPSPWLTRFAGRAVSKFASLLTAGFSLKPDVFIGYHLFPAGISALIVARLLGRMACYQMTGGPAELLGGGAYDENRLLAKLRRPSPFLERLAMAVVHQFDLVVVRGSRAKTFLTDRGVRAVTVITGSVAVPANSSLADRPYDLVFVGRLVAIKQPLQFVEIVATLRRRLPGIRAAIVGDGPLLDTIRNRAIALDLERSIHFLGQTENVESILMRSKLFLLTSRSEGLSIAMAEAMAAGVVPIVANVGDLGDLVDDGVTGFLVTPDSVPEFVRRATLLLQDSELWTRHSVAARRAASRHTSVDVVKAKWAQSLTTLLAASAASAATRTPSAWRDES